MIRDQQLEGFNLLQCPEITSSSDFYLEGFRPSVRRYRYSFIERPIYSRFLRDYSRNRFNSANRRQPSREILNSHDPQVPENPPLHILFQYLSGTERVPTQTVKSTLSTKTALLTVAVIFITSFLALLLVYANFPQVTSEERQHIRLPWNIEQAKKLGIILSKYKDDHYVPVLTGVFLSYIFLQTFAIPGSLFLSILSGFLFPFYLALALVCICSALGASLCFLLSQLLGRRLMAIYYPEKVSKWATVVEKHRGNLLNYIIFLRVTPFLPNWFINLTAPMIGVPLIPFALGTFLGVAPPSFVAIQAGQTLQTMTSNDTGFSWSSVLLLAIFAVISLIPVFIKNKLKEKFE